MLLEKNNNIYTIYNSEKILKKMSDMDLIKLMCDDNTDIFENSGIYVFDDWDILKNFTKEEIDVICTLVNDIKSNDTYFRVTRNDTSLFVTNTDFIHDELHNQVWTPIDPRGIGGIFTCILVPKGKELNDYICVIHSDEDHEKNMEIMTIKVKATEWFENCIIPKIQGVFEDLEVVL